MSIETLGIVGSGSGGAELAELAAVAGMDVVALHVEGDDPLAVWDAVTFALGRQVEWESLGDAGREVAMSRVHLASEPAMLAACDLVFECATNLPIEARRAILADIEQHIDARAILASRASVLQAENLAPTLLRPCRFVGLDLLHRDATRFVEVIPTERTRGAVVEAVEAWVVRTGRQPLRISVPGGVVGASREAGRMGVGG
jgi:3-hydroxybutyryl-CoA dehydrogenase